MLNNPKKSDPAPLASDSANHKSIRRLLIANRGEIACRVIRTARSLGIQTIAVYSDADAEALHVKLADEAVHIGPSAPGESYLVIDRLVAAAKSARADAVHPGYGFLSERAAFAKAMDAAGITFVGPTAHAIDLMGDKARSKRAMIEAGVPCVPGYQGDDQSAETLCREAEKVGFPLMVKAAAGGGGRGMRLVTRPEDLRSALATARSEAESAFGSGELILEKAIIKPRHVEIQVFGDTHGNVIYLGERDCSVQRRHQKVVEEAPCPVMTPQLRASMGEAAVTAAKAVDYVGAGTVEFLLAANGEFYFLEMNTRLQVEHPVTEAVTGLDLVELQLRVAQGEPLGLAQSDVRMAGHAIEVRLYAEDPENDFRPSAGRIDLWSRPSGSGIRVDDGIETGGAISPFYDPMVAKVIAHGANREEARRRLIAALNHTALIGPANNRDFLIDVLDRETFARGDVSTAFIAEEYGDAGFTSKHTIEDWGLAALFVHIDAAERSKSEAMTVSVELLDWCSTGELKSVYILAIDDEEKHVEIIPGPHGSYSALLDERQIDFRVLDINGPDATVETPEGRRAITFHVAPHRHCTVSTPTKQISAQIRGAGRGEEDASGSGRVLSAMHGRMIAILVQEGDPVSKGQAVAIIEAMKMQQQVLADVSGIVKMIASEAGAQIAAEDLILEIEPGEEAEAK